jgi:hypothetical protein
MKFYPAKSLTNAADGELYQKEKKNDKVSAW